MVGGRLQLLHLGPVEVTDEAPSNEPVEEDASQQDEQRRFHGQRPETLSVGIEERDAIRLRERPEDPRNHDQGPDRRDGGRAPRVSRVRTFAYDRAPHKTSIKRLIASRRPPEPARSAV
jgi:hypothetical protein